MRIATATPAAVPSTPVTPASAAQSDGATTSGSSFANQLDAASAETGEQTPWNITIAAASFSRGSRLPGATPQNGETQLQTSAAQASLAWPPAAGFSTVIPHSSAKRTLEAGPPPSFKPAARTASKPQTAAQKTPSAGADSILAPPVLTSPTDPAITAAASEDAETIDLDAGAPAPHPATHNRPEESPEAAEPVVTTPAGSSAQPQDMAFAARVQPVQGADQAALPAEMASNAAVAAANKKEVATEEATASPAETPMAAAAATIATERNPAPPSSAPAAASAPATAAHRTEAPAPVAETAPKSTAPLKDISLQVNQPGSERVDVRVVQQGSEVHVSVHSSDAALNSGLRQGLSDLQSRLTENGYRSEMWRPGVATAPIAASPSTQSSSNFSRGNDGQPQQQGGSQQESGRRNQNQSNQPQWLEEMESSVHNGQQPSGGFYGFGS